MSSRGLLSVDSHAGKSKISAEARNGRKETPLPCRLMDESEAAEYFRCSVAFLRRCRLYKKGPQFIKLGRLVRYSLADLEAYLATNKEVLAA